MVEEFDEKFLKKAGKVATQAALKAGKSLLKNYKKDLEFFSKGTNDFATNADLEAEKIILDVIRKNFPEHSILSEEAGKDKLPSDFVWCVDPLDGTHNFARKLPFFGTSVGLAYKGVPIVGAIFLPVQNELFFAVKGKGAFLNGKKISVSRVSEFAKAYASFEAYPKTALLYKEFQKIAKLGLENLLTFSCAVVDLLLVSKGKVEFCIFFKTHAWDCCAAVIIIEEAGGRVTNLKGKKWDISHGEILASNSIIHEKIF
ncbi:MAG: inositol monophosphatase family protein [Candidatus Diapherotrites archaeon]|nr:inositol monophosphatase family protein [Candidatus Diapherotrites archaeon]